MSIVRHGGRSRATRNSEARLAEEARQHSGAQAQRLSFESQEARRAVARAALRGGWTEQIPEVLDALGLDISAAQFKRLCTMEQRANAGVTYKPGRSRPTTTGKRAARAAS